MEGEPLAAGVGNCVARPGGPQQLLVLQPHAVVQPHSVRLHFRHGHKDALGNLSATPATPSCSAGCFGLFGYTHWLVPNRNNP